MTKVVTSRDGAGDWLKRGAEQGGIERFEAFFQGSAYGPHRHDSYAIGITLAGVQLFRYRAALRHSLAGQAIVLHPDELHDGQAGTADGFRYRIAYVDPGLLQRVLGGTALPYIGGGVSADVRLVRAAHAMLSDFDTAPEPLAQDDALFGLASALQQVAGKATHHSGDFRAVQLAREYIHDCLHARVSLGDLETAAGRDRWSLARDFRTFLGTSPHRYVTMRRLARAKQMMMLGLPLAEVAAHAGFADQSHLTRHFAAAFGMPPARWLRLHKRSRPGSA